ncbi:MAG TPA: hypothetical protein VN688_02595 [Gemmataceae bacterium]|nr:hypothetical protein [Gemmataceae bacterium]
MTGEFVYDLRRDRGLLLVPRLTMLLTHATVMLESDAGEIQITLE